MCSGRSTAPACSAAADQARRRLTSRRARLRDRRGGPDMSEPQLLSAWAGHWTGNGTGVTVILPPPGTVGSGEVRGGAPATREFALLDPTRLVHQVDAVVLSGGSAFGLSAGDGVV